MAPGRSPTSITLSRPRRNFLSAVRRRNDNESYRRSSAVSACRCTSRHSPPSRRNSSVTRSVIATGVSLSFIITLVCWRPVQKPRSPELPDWSTSKWPVLPDLKSLAPSALASLTCDAPVKTLPLGGKNVAGSMVAEWRQAGRGYGWPSAASHFRIAVAASLR